MFTQLQIGLITVFNAEEGLVNPDIQSRTTLSKHVTIRDGNYCAWVNLS